MITPKFDLRLLPINWLGVLGAMAGWGNRNDGTA